jgi:hypothetical protein
MLLYSSKSASTSLTLTAGSKNGIHIKDYTYKLTSMQRWTYRCVNARVSIAHRHSNKQWNEKHANLRHWNFIPKTFKK